MKRSQDVSFAIVLMTPDDSGSALASESTRLRARQNVLYELGYFAGKLGRGKVLVLRKGDIEILQILPGFSIPSLMSMVDGNANC